MIAAIHHFSISCADAARSLAFYRDVFGLTLVSEREVAAGGFVERVTGVRGANVRLVHLQGYGVNFELIEYLQPRGEARAREPNHAGSAHLCFVADDLDSTYEDLKARGVTFRSPEGPVRVVGGPNDGGKGLYLEDPDGNAVEIIELARPWPHAGDA